MRTVRVYIYARYMYAVQKVFQPFTIPINWYPWYRLVTMSSNFSAVLLDVTGVLYDYGVGAIAGSPEAVVRSVNYSLVHVSILYLYCVSTG